MKLGSTQQRRLRLLGSGALAAAIPFLAPLPIESIPTVSCVVFVVLCAVFRCLSSPATTTFVLGFSVSYFIAIYLNPLQSLTVNPVPPEMVEIINGRLKWYMALMLLTANFTWIFASPAITALVAHMLSLRLTRQAQRI